MRCDCNNRYKKTSIIKMGAMCGSNKKKDETTVVVEEKPGHLTDQNQSNAVVVREEPEHPKTHEEPNHMQSPPKNEPEVALTEEQRQKLIQECLDYVKDVGVEGSVQNMQDNVDIVAVRQDLNFE